MSQQSYKKALTFNIADDGTKYINEEFTTVTDSFVSVTGDFPDITAIAPRFLSTGEGGTNNDTTFDTPTSVEYQGFQGEDYYQNLLWKIKFVDTTQDRWESRPIDTYESESGNLDIGEGIKRFMYATAGNQIQLVRGDSLFSTGEGSAGMGAHNHGTDYLLTTAGDAIIDLSYGTSIADPNHPNYQEAQVTVIYHDAAANTLLIRLPYTSYYAGIGMNDEFCDEITIKNSVGASPDTRGSVHTNGLIAGVSGRNVLLNTNVSGFEFDQAGADCQVFITDFKYHIDQKVDGDMIEVTSDRAITYNCQGVQADTATIDDASTIDYIAGTGITTAVTLDTDAAEWVVSEIEGGGAVTENTFTLTVQNTVYDADARLEIVNSGGTADADMRVSFFNPKYPSFTTRAATVQSSGGDHSNVSTARFQPEMDVPPGSLAVGQMTISGTQIGTNSTDPAIAILTINTNAI